MLAHFFLWHLKIRMGKKAPSITLSQLRVLLKLILPMKQHTLETLIETGNLDTEPKTIGPTCRIERGGMLEVLDVP